MLIKLGKYMGRMGKSFQNLPSNCNRKKVLLFSKECQMQLKTNKDRKKSQTMSKTEASAKPFKSGRHDTHDKVYSVRLPCRDKVG